MARSEDLKTPLARLSFPNLFKPQKNDKGVEQYNCVLLFPKTTDMSQLRDAAVKAVVDEWGDKAKEALKVGAIKSPFLDGDGPQGVSKKTLERHIGYEGHWFLRVGSTQQPRVVNKKVLPAAPDEAYAGCYVYAVVNAYTWVNDQNGRGVSFGLNLVQVAKDGERLGGGGGDPDKFFDKIEDEGEAPTATKEGAGAGGLFA